MAKKGIVDPAKIQETINSLFSNQMAAQIVGIYATQQARIEKDRGVIAGTMDTPQAAHTIMERDPLIAAEGLKNAIENLSSVFADKALDLAPRMTSMAEAINGFSARLQEAYGHQERGEEIPISEGQKAFNRTANSVVAWIVGQPDPDSDEDGLHAAQRSDILQARQDAAQDPELRKAMERKRAEAAKLRAEANKIPPGAPAQQAGGVLGYFFSPKEDSQEERARSWLKTRAAQLEKDAGAIDLDLDRSKRANAAADRADDFRRQRESYNASVKRWAPPEAMELPSTGVGARSPADEVPFALNGPAMKGVWEPPQGGGQHFGPEHFINRQAYEDSLGTPMWAREPLGPPRRPGVYIIEAGIEPPDSDTPPIGGPAPIPVRPALTPPPPPLPRFSPPGVHPDFTLDNMGGGFSPGYGAGSGFDKFPGHHAPEFDSVPTHPTAVDDSALDGLMNKTHLAQDAMTALGATAITPQISPASIDAYLAKLERAVSLQASLGNIPGGTGPRANLGPSYPAAAPTGRMGGPR